MFLELHMLDDEEKIMININKIQSIGHVNVGRINEAVAVDVGDSIFRVKESYEQIHKAMSKIALIESVESEE